MGADYFNKLFSYDPTSGKLFWKINKGTARSGNCAGVLNKLGYIRIGIDKKNWYAHRIIWIMHNGEIPQELEIDHINGIRDDNRIDNLRCVNRTVNSQNKKHAQCNNKLGFFGVHKMPNGKFRSQIELEGKKYHIGIFDTIEEAHKSYMDKKQQLHKGFTF